MANQLPVNVPYKPTETNPSNTYHTIVGADAAWNPINISWRFRRQTVNGAIFCVDFPSNFKGFFRFSPYALEAGAEVSGN